jgi:serine/threonine protein kinase
MLHEPVHCIVMEKIDGLDLKQWMKQQGNQPISEKQALNWLKQVADILHLVHQKNYFHRDIKPANIMIRSTGQLVLIDFGTARELTYTYLAEVGVEVMSQRLVLLATPPRTRKRSCRTAVRFLCLGTYFCLFTDWQAGDR